jgi:GNAT superfamily N-acetyltransferase
VAVDEQLISIGPASPADAGEILTVQRAAYVSEAQLYDNPKLSALTETLGAIRVATETGGVLVAKRGGRLVVAPDLQGRGIGRALLDAVENTFPARRFVLHTGARSAGRAIVGIPAKGIGPAGVTGRAESRVDQWKACSGAGNSRVRTSAANWLAALASTPAISA